MNPNPPAPRRRGGGKMRARRRPHPDTAGRAGVSAAFPPTAPERRDARPSPVAQPSTRVPASDAATHGNRPDRSAACSSAARRRSAPPPGLHHREGTLEPVAPARREGDRDLAKAVEPASTERARTSIGWSCPFQPAGIRPIGGAGSAAGWDHQTIGGSRPDHGYRIGRRGRSSG